MKKASRSHHGFTIVELLIVIVVIGILGVISIVSYNGMRSKAERSVLASDSHNIRNKIEIFQVETQEYPVSINDCPSPAAINMCIQPSDGLELQYTQKPISTSGYLKTIKPGYDLSLQGANQFIYQGNDEKTNTREFMQYVDLAPFINKYGLQEYQLSFDIKSADTSRATNISVYFQNGSNARYGGLSYSVQATTEYKRHTVKFRPVLAGANIQQSMLAFYGTYDSGNIPSVKDVEFSLAT